MAYYDQAGFEVRCEWADGGVTRLEESDVIVIVDVLSFTTCVDIALGRGVRVYPYRWKDETAIAYAAERGAEVAVSRGEAGRFEGRYSLAPSSLETAEAGLRLVLPSPNGSSLAFEAACSEAVVVAGCLRNAAAIAAWVNAFGCGGRTVTVVPSGERWEDGTLRPAIEDLIGAGAILSRLSGRRSPEAEVALSAFEGSADAGGAEKGVADRLLACVSGRELIGRGFERDVALASELDVSGVVPVLEGDAFMDAGR